METSTKLLEKMNMEYKYFKSKEMIKNLGEWLFGDRGGRDWDKLGALNILVMFCVLSWVLGARVFILLALKQ